MTIDEFNEFVIFVYRCLLTTLLAQHNSVQSKQHAWGLLRMQDGSDADLRGIRINCFGPAATYGRPM